MEAHGTLRCHAQAGVAGAPNVRDVFCIGLGPKSTGEPNFRLKIDPVISDRFRDIV